MRASYQRMSDEDRKAITAKIREVAKFQSGDMVTVEPNDPDDPDFFGSEYMGVPLTIDEPIWREVTIGEGSVERTLANDYASEDNVIELPSGKLAYVDDYHVEYSFEECPFVRVGTTAQVHSMGERPLITWEKYKADHDRVMLLTPKSNHETAWLQTDTYECNICGCNTMEHWHYNNGVQTAGGHKCAACGDVKEQHAP